jgi:hypothetical protein
LAKFVPVEARVVVPLPLMVNAASLLTATERVLVGAVVPKPWAYARDVPKIRAAIVRSAFFLIFFSYGFVRLPLRRSVSPGATLGMTVSVGVLALGAHVTLRAKPGKSKIAAGFSN